MSSKTHIKKVSKSEENTKDKAIDLTSLKAPLMLNGSEATNTT